MFDGANEPGQVRRVFTDTTDSYHPTPENLPDGGLSMLAGSITNRSQGSLRIDDVIHWLDQYAPNSLELKSYLTAKQTGSGANYLVVHTEIPSDSTEAPHSLLSTHTAGEWKMGGSQLIAPTETWNIWKYPAGVEYNKETLTWTPNGFPITASGQYLAYDLTQLNPLLPGGVHWLERR